MKKILILDGAYIPGKLVSNVALKFAKSKALKFSSLNIHMYNIIDLDMKVQLRLRI